MPQVELLSISNRSIEHYQGYLWDVTCWPAAFSMITFNYILLKSLIEKQKCMNGNKKNKDICMIFINKQHSKN